jgi:serine protease
VGKNPLRLTAFLAAMACAGVAAAQTDARVIVKYRADSALVRKSASTVEEQPQVIADALGQRLGIALHAGSPVGARINVMTATGMDADQLAARIAAQPDIEYAVPDRRRHRLSKPNDPLFASGPSLLAATGGPPAGQWYLHAPSSDALSAINAELAWNLVIGNPTVVVADIDTGVRFDHRDLLSVAAGGNLLPGYDMISDPAGANDGDGRDPDPSDPGDWVTLDEIQNKNGPFYKCTTAAENSSWHGTQTSGLMGALTDNGIGMASVGRTVRILPVRVLGKCGGLDSDIIAGMLWAAGIAVPNVPSNPYPARVLNLSLGSDEACNVSYIDAVSQVRAQGAVVVASAGNATGHAVGLPANCPGVIAVAGLRHAGTKVGFSSLGPEIAVSAPAGNCVNTLAGQPCLYPILSATNPGTTTPVPDAAGGSIYSDSFDPSLGTSFSAPLVAGTAALMFAAQPALTPDQVRALLQASARAFPVSSDPTISQCVAPQPIGATQVDQAECSCTTTTCGAGMVDAAAAVRAAIDLKSMTVVEFYNAALDHYFITWLPAEIAILDAGITIKGWTRTGQSFHGYTAAQAGTSPVCRFYIPPLLGNSHYFGRATQECNDTAAKNPTFVLEDPAFMQMFLPAAGVCPQSTVPVYRVFDNRPDANHRYMTDRALRDQMVAKGWLAEGDGPDLVVMCAPL